MNDPFTHRLDLTNPAALTLTQKLFYLIAICATNRMIVDATYHTMHNSIFSLSWDFTFLIGHTYGGDQVWQRFDCIFRLYDELNRVTTTVDIPLKEPTRVEDIVKQQVLTYASEHTSTIKPFASARTQSRFERAIKFFQKAANHEDPCDRELDRCLENDDSDIVVSLLVYAHDNDPAIRDLFNHYKVSPFICWSIRPDCAEFAKMNKLKGGWRGRYNNAVSHHSKDNTLTLSFT